MNWKVSLKKLFYNLKPGYVEHNPPTFSEVEQLVEAIVSKKEKELKEDFKLRMAAETINVKNKFSKQFQQDKKYSSLPAMRDLIEFSDNFRLGMNALESGENATEGFEMLGKQLDDILAKNGVEKIDAKYMNFDPNLHEAMRMVPNDEHGKSIITEELKIGYKMYDRVIRASKVEVSSGKIELNEDAE